MRYETSIHHGVDRLAALSDKWDAVFRRIPAPGFYHLLGWWKSYARALLPDDCEFMVALIENGVQPICVAPLERRTAARLGVRVREVGLPRHDHVPLNDITCRPALSGSDFLTSLKRALALDGGWDVLVFKWVLDGSSISELLKNDPMSVSTVLNFCDYLDCSRPYEEIFAGFSSNFRSNLNKARNKLKRESGVEFTAISDPSELPRALDEFMRLEASGWKGEEGEHTAIRLDASLIKFYRGLIDELGPTSHIVINMLKVGGELIAAQFCANVGETLYVLKLAYDERWSRVAPGNMLMEWVIQQAGRNGSPRYLNMVNDPAWFKAWGVQSVPLLYVERFNFTPVGIALMLQRRAKRLVKPVYVWCLDRLRRLRQAQIAKTSNGSVRRDNGAQAPEAPAARQDRATRKPQQ